MNGKLKGRLARLESVMSPDTGHCRSCGLRHVQPLTMDLVRRIVGVSEWASLALQREVAENPAPRLCLCDSCCGDPRDCGLTGSAMGSTSHDDHGPGYPGGRVPANEPARPPSGGPHQVG
jgi:hypothetical protein